MPGRDGTGPRGEGPMTGRRGGGSGPAGGRAGGGPGGYCKCPKCGSRVNHTAGSPCSSLACPQCGTSMVRE